MLNGRDILIGILCVLFVASTALGQTVEVLKAELKGVEGRLDAKIDGAVGQLNTKIDGAASQLDTKIDGVKNELNTKIDGAKGELNANIDRVKSEATTIKWIIGGIGAVFLVFLGVFLVFLAHLLNFYVKKVLPNMVQQESRGREGIEAGRLQEEVTGEDRFADNTQSGYQPAGGRP